MKLSTIGYERRTLPELIDALRGAGVSTLVDVRAVAASRRAGFSKTLLGNSLEAAGVSYLHLRDLGTPKAGRDAAKAGRTAEMRAIFEAHLQEPQAGLALARLAELAEKEPVALLCFEAEACRCHRAILAARVCEATGCEVADL